MIYSPRHTSGFSTLMALGTIGILLIIVTGLATIYINEMRLSRTSYDEIVALENAEGAFEYGMLKIRNHREGFEDTLTSLDPDGKMLDLVSERSKNMKTSYTIESASTDSTFSIEQNEHLIIPLFTANESVIPGGILSKNPTKNPAIKIVRDLGVSGLPIDLTWTIVAMSGTENTGLSGMGNITSVTPGKIRERGADCYDSDGTKLLNCIGTYAEMLPYFYDIETTVGGFLTSSYITDPYLLIYNPTARKDIRITSNPSTPFTLPVMQIEASAKKNDSLQVFRFTEDKSRYYDALKYGIYNTTP